MKNIITATILTLSIVGCTDRAPKCNDEEATDLVIEIANEELIKTGGKALAKNIKFTLKNIRTTDINEKVGSYECAADLEMSGTGGTHSGAITYTSELTDDGDAFYVEVEGL